MTYTQVLKWDESQHPRNKGGRFASSGGAPFLSRAGQEKVTHRPGSGDPGDISHLHTQGIPPENPPMRVTFPDARQDIRAAAQRAITKPTLIDDLLKGAANLATTFGLITPEPNTYEYHMTMARKARREANFAQRRGDMKAMRQFDAEHERRVGLANASPETPRRGNDFI